MRTSGYWLYGSEYSEWYFSNKYWPEFDAQELDKALEQFSGAIRNFGK
jgi:undecaprenyl diphosphate synthase